MKFGLKKIFNCTLNFIYDLYMKCKVKYKRPLSNLKNNKNKNLICLYKNDKLIDFCIIILKCFYNK